MKKEFVVVAFALSCSSFSSPALADTHWHRGEVTRIWQHGEQGQFSITLDPAVEACPDQRIEFSGDAYANADRRGQALSMVLSGLHGDKKIGVFVEQDGSGTRCLAQELDIQR
ncbi:hypothetical protein ACRYJU_04405 [Alloalcanivorax xenomutans]|uniref:hypothetical protein n=1 Tax=Alloalcanivorax xenomutans TaxID=1094342 RepID=UPI003D9B1D24